VEPVVNPVDTDPVSSLGRALARRWPIVVGLALIALIAATASVAHRSASYHSTAKLLLNPLPQYDITFIGTGLLRDGGDPGGTAATTAQVLHSRTMAREAGRLLGDGTTPGSVLGAVQVTPAVQTNVLDVVATAGRPARAVRIANSFIGAVQSTRWRTISPQLDRRIAALTARSAQAVGGGSADQLRALRAARDSGSDPTVQVAQLAGPAVASSRTPAPVVLVLALLGGAFLGALVALGIDRASPRVRDEDDVLLIYPLPVWGRIPQARRRRREQGPLPPAGQGPAAHEAFRTIAAHIDRWAPEGGVIALISAAEGDGRSSAALGLGAALSELDRAHDIEVIDGPPVTHGTELSGMGTATDLVLVVRLGHTSRRQLRQARDVLEGMGARPVGLLLVGTGRGRGRSRQAAGREEAQAGTPLPLAEPGGLGVPWEASPRG
jgi:capsular polysaccharide biosynthesis protein